MDVERVKTWLRDDMKYVNTLPDDDQLRLLCGSALEGVWGHLVDHCRSQETVKHVQGNISVARKKLYLENSSSLSSTNIGMHDGGEKDELLSERNSLTSKLHETLAKFDRLRIAMTSAEEDRRNLHKNKEEYTNSIREHRRSSLLLTLYIKQVQGLLHKLSSIVEKQKVIQQGLRSKKQATKDQPMFSVERGMESEGERNLRLAVNLVLKHMASLLDTMQLNGSKHELRREILRLLSMVPCSTLETALLRNLQSQINSVSSRRESFDLLEEAKHMKLKANVSMDGGIMTSFGEELGLLYQKHITVFHEVKKAKKRLEDLEAELQKSMEMYKNNATNYKEVHQEMLKCVDRASNEFKQAEVERLESLLCQLTTENEDQQSILNWVKNAQSNIQDVISTISALMDSNNQGIKKLQHRQAVVDELMNRLPDVMAKLKISLQKSVEEPSDMLKSFIQVPVNRYCSTMVEGPSESVLAPTLDLQLYRLGSCYPYPSLEEDGFMVSQSSRQDLCFQVRKLLSEIQHLKTKTQGEEMNTTLTTVRQLTDNLRASKNQQINDFKPMLAETDSCRVKGVEVCETVNSALQDFHLQATQAVLASDQCMLVEGRSFAQWKEVLRVAVANTKS